VAVEDAAQSLDPGHGAGQISDDLQYLALDQSIQLTVSGVVIARAGERLHTGG
jgi:hypothetical protein